jgi:outer membrane protein W
MKKFFIIGALLAGSMNIANTVSAQAVEEGNILVDAYYGFPNLYTAVFKNLYANSGSELNLNIGGAGPVGIRAEYMLADKFGMGLDLGYQSSKIEYDEYDSYDNKTYNYKYSTSKISAIVTFNYHLLESSDNLDLYLVGGIGYGNRTFKEETDNPNYTTVDFKSVIPVATRLGFGMRYFFTDNIGVNAAIGLGNGLLTGGLSIKL